MAYMGDEMKYDCFKALDIAEETAVAAVVQSCKAGQDSFLQWVPRADNQCLL
jgi:hypothetical protein